MEDSCPSSWYAASCEAPANMNNDPRDASIQLYPRVIGVKPAINPNGIIPGRNGVIACIPRSKHLRRLTGW